MSYRGEVHQKLYFKYSTGSPPILSYLHGANVTRYSNMPRPPLHTFSTKLHLGNSVTAYCAIGSTDKIVLYRPSHSAYERQKCYFGIRVHVNVTVGILTVSGDQWP